MSPSFLSEMQRIARQAARDAERAEKLAERKRKADEREAAKALRKSEKDAQDAYIATQVAHVAELNSDLQAAQAALADLLSSGLARDPFIDLNDLKIPVTHPPFDRPELEVPIPEPGSPEAPEMPVLVLPPPLGRLGALFGKSRHEEAVAKAHAEHKVAMEGWAAATASLERQHEAALRAHQQAEAERLACLDEERTRYKSECQTREEEAVARDARIDQLIADLGYGVGEAVEEYVALVLGQSEYPDECPVSHEVSFDSSTAELEARVSIPEPSKLPRVKVYKYVKAKDQIAETELSNKAQKDRYAGIIDHIALRTLHEIFQSDRRGLIQTISLIVGTKADHPVTGHYEFIPLLATGAAREDFLSFDLSSVVPSATLKHLGASVSKNALALEAADTSGIMKA